MFVLAVDQLFGLTGGLAAELVLETRQRRGVSPPPPLSLSLSLSLSALGFTSAQTFIKVHYFGSLGHI